MTRRVIVLHEESGHTDSPLVRDGLSTVNAAREAGCEIFGFSSDYDILGTAAEALEHVPIQTAPTPAVWIGFVPSPERYRDIYEAAHTRNLVLLNTPDEYRLTSELDLFYPRLGELTFRTESLSDPNECERVAAALGFPLFVKGAVRSARTKGWRACVAENLEELRALVRDLLAMENRSRGRVVVRQLARLRHIRKTEHGFPLGREYRVILHRGEVLADGYYWEGEDALSARTDEERETVRALAEEAARRVGVPFMTIDVGQLEDGTWKVIETGDPQFAGWSQAPRALVFAKLRAWGGEGTAS